MSQVLTPNPVIEYFRLSDYPTTASLPDGRSEPLPSEWQRVAMNLIIEVIRARWPGRNDWYVTGDMYIYWRRLNDVGREIQAVLGPDAFVVFDVPWHERRKWATWDEGGRFPDVIVEFQSESTRHLDFGPKKDAYEQIFKSDEYFCYDRDRDRLRGWRLVDGTYQDIAPDGRGYLWSDRLQCWFGRWDGEWSDLEATYLRTYFPDGTLVPTVAEANRREADASRRDLNELLAKLRAAGIDPNTL